jgi:hypothetical protein
MRSPAKLVVFGGIVVIALLVILPSVLPPIDRAAKESCFAKMRKIEGAIATWAMEHHKTTNEVVTWADLVGPGKYLPDRPACPHGGTYSITTVGAGPTCSIPEDTAYFRQP